MMSADKVILVTGSAQRLGAATVREFHRRGWRVLIHCRRSQEAADALATELNAQRPDSARVLSAALNQFPAIQRLAAEAVSSWGRLDALVNNASSFFPTPVDTATPEQWHDLFSSNAEAPFFLAQALLPALRESRGSIINMADIHASRPLAGHTLYCMAKAALLMMTKSLARELAPDIRVNAIAPGAILWPEHADTAMQEKILANIPLGHCGTPEDIARAIAFLVIDSPYITGQILAVDGGRSL
jgi:pteridine reductase